MTYSVLLRQMQAAAGSPSVALEPASSGPLWMLGILSRTRASPARCSHPCRRHPEGMMRRRELVMCGEEAFKQPLPPSHPEITRRDCQDGQSGAATTAYYARPTPIAARKTVEVCPSRPASSEHGYASRELERALGVGAIKATAEPCRAGKKHN
ncbi:hypothetical protein BDY21DRAFT_166679 [Lineolata rhizophorae]|uniref:Uncharacterized protein n=1 Tax=Lineolata rhizophorae TaxID=578093 RepID=A0A6A6P9G1_9PEZI|nr:hypothetical protein BDY21DRAFT_166679 [Lineolata rhizophorae]